MNDKAGHKVITLLFGIVVALFLGGLIILSFFNHASADDYFALQNEQQYGILGFQQFVYLHWGGRYFSNLIAALFSSNAFLLRHYHLHTILLILATILATYSLISSISEYIINKSVGKKEQIILSLLITVNFFVAYPELSTSLFWFSSAVTYQTSVILLMLLMSVTLKYLNTSIASKINYWYLLLIVLLVIAINGSNEVSALLGGMMLIVLLIANKKKYQEKKMGVLLVTIVYTACLLALIVAPGNRERMNVLDGKNVNILLSVASSFYRVFIIFWHIFLSPLCWVTLAAIFLYANHIRTKIFLLQHHKANLHTILLLMGIWSIMLLMVLIPILLISNGSIPDRALNVLSAATIIVLMMTAFYMGLCIKNKNVRELLSHKQLQFTVAVSVIICVIANNSSKEIASSLIAAKTYHQVLKERETMLQQSYNNRFDTISLPSIDMAMETALKLKGGNQKATLKQWMQKKPSLLFVTDDLATEGSRKVLQEYYQIKLIKRSSENK